MDFTAATTKDLDNAMPVSTTVHSRPNLWTKVTAVQRLDIHQEKGLSSSRSSSQSLPRFGLSYWPTPKKEMKRTTWLAATFRSGLMARLACHAMQTRPSRESTTAVAS